MATFYDINVKIVGKKNDIDNFINHFVCDINIPYYHKIGTKKCSFKNIVPIPNIIDKNDIEIKNIVEVYKFNNDPYEKSWMLLNWGLPYDLYDNETVSLLRVNDEILLLTFGIRKFDIVNFILNTSLIYKKLKFFINIMADLHMFTNSNGYNYIIENGSMDDIFYHDKMRFGILTKSELNFYHVLNNIINNINTETNMSLTILSKVRLIDLLYIREEYEKYDKYVNEKVWAKHVDFVIATKEDLKPFLVIELDDVSHNNDDRKKVDNFKNNILYGSGIDILRVPVKYSYDIHLLKIKVKELIFYKL